MTGSGFEPGTSQSLEGCFYHYERALLPSQRRFFFEVLRKYVEGPRLPPSPEDVPTLRVGWAGIAAVG